MYDFTHMQHYLSLAWPNLGSFLKFESNFQVHFRWLFFTLLSSIASSSHKLLAFSLSTKSIGTFNLFYLDFYWFSLGTFHHFRKVDALINTSTSYGWVISSWCLFFILVLFTPIHALLSLAQTWPPCRVNGSSANFHPHYLFKVAPFMFHQIFLDHKCIYLAWMIPYFTSEPRKDPLIYRFMLNGIYF
jgi:hypothetical protein